MAVLLRRDFLAARAMAVPCKKWKGSENGNATIIRIRRADNDALRFGVLKLSQ
jgi:hypothetical protein